MTATPAPSTQPEPQVEARPPAWLVLADGLPYARQTYSPDEMIDIATLTGAAMMACGPWATAGLGNDDELLEALRLAR